MAERKITLHDTRSGEQKCLRERGGDPVGIYVCGPTVYGRVHVGNARPFVVFSQLKRFLEQQGYAVTFVSNVTDINDKIYAAANEAGIDSEQLAREMTAHYVADTDGLGLGRPDAEPLATETLGPITALIESLIERGHAYESGGDVYFDVASYKRYGEVSHQQIAEMDQGEGVAGADLKRSPLDFALWKATKPDEDASWESPWGLGRPGWHIECSAMAEELLGVGFDIHGGGIDLVFPHHENEAAQTCAARGEDLAQIWMHNGMVRLEGEKMAKSVGNIRLLHAALEEFGRDALVIYFAGGHYRQPIAFSADALDEAKARIARIREAARKLPPGPSAPELATYREEFFDALASDFNTPRALASLFEWIRKANRSGGGGDSDLREMLTVLGLENLLDSDVEEIPHAVRELVTRREEARVLKEFAAADELRAEIERLGYAVRDADGGASVVPLDG